MTRRRHRRWLWGALIALLLGVFLFVPTPYYLEVPGGADKTSQFVTVDGKHDKASGSYRLMTVSVYGPTTPAMLLWGQLQPFKEVVTKQDLMGKSSSDEYDALQHYYIESAAANATAAAFKAAKRPVKVSYQGIYVLSILPQSHFADVLKVGDTITAVNGEHYNTADEYVAAVKSHRTGTAITITYERNGKKKTATRALVKLPGEKRAGLGITLTDHTTVTTEPKVKVDAGQIGGPSAGLIFALQVYDQLTGNHLRRGRTIAGTGTMTATGQVGVIGGIDKKVYTADKAGATIFFAPRARAPQSGQNKSQSNYAEAKAAAKKMNSRMRIVPVSTLQDAIDYLQQTK